MLYTRDPWRGVHLRVIGSVERGSKFLGPSTKIKTCCLVKTKGAAVKHHTSAASVIEESVAFRGEDEVKQVGHYRDSSTAG